jgi:hypothetical protein
MGRKIMLEVTQPVVSGNEVVVAAGTLFEPGAKLPDGVTVREVITDVPDEPEPKAEPAKAPAEPAKAQAKAPAK